MVVLETLSPAERTTWVLHDLFGMRFSEVADIVGRTPAAVRQLAARARRHVADSAGGDLAGLLRVLDPDVVLTADGGGLVTAARRAVVGADRVSRFILGIADNVRDGQHLGPGR